MRSIVESEKENHLPAPRPTIARAAAWDVVGRLANYCVLFFVGIVLTRLLSPEEFGTFAIVLSVITFSSIFIDLGFRSAIIQSQNTTQTELSTVFFLNLAIAILVLSIFVVGSIYIEEFYQVRGLKTYISAASGLFIINALGLIPGGLLQKELRLKALSLINTSAAVISGGTAVVLAVLGFGIWTLIVQQVISALVVLIGTTVLSGWRPSFSFSLPAINGLWHFGVRIFLSSCLDILFTRLDVLVIGKLFPIQTLGYYNRAQSLDGLVRNFSANTTASVAFPVIARMAGDVNAVRSFYLRCLNAVSFLAFLLIGLLFLTCFDIITILFTERWIEVGYYFRIMAVTGFVYPISALMVNLIAARGNAAAFLRLEMWKKAVLFPSYLSFLVGGVYFFLVALGTAYLVALLLNAQFVQKEISIPIGTQLFAIYRYCLVALLGVAAVLGATSFLQNIYLHFAIASTVFAGIYLFFCYKLKLPGFLEIYERALTFYNDKRNPNISSAA